jgi:hypothetical protein
VVNVRRLRDPDQLLFFALLALHVAPLWAFRYFPSQDGPTHLENAVILRDYDRPDRLHLRAFYTLSAEFDPNWFGHLALCCLLRLFPPLIAEKVLLTGYLILLPLAARYALDGVRPGAGWLAVLTFPFLQHFLFHMGFYNFCYGLAVLFLVAGYWLRHADAFGVRPTLTLAALVVLLYFCHIVAVVMALVLVGTLAVGWTLRDHRPRRLLGPALAFVPAVLLGLAFLGRQKSATSWELQPAVLLARLAELEVLVSYFDLERLFSRLMSLVLIALAAILLLVRWRARLLERRDWLLAAVVLAVVAYFTAPSALAGGSFLNTRLSLFVFFFLILWLGAHTFGPRLKRAVQGTAAVVALGLLALHAWAYAAFNAHLADYTTLESCLKPGTTLLPLNFAHGLRTGPLAQAKVGAFRNAAGYLAACCDIVELENYEANTSYFPVRYRPGLNPFDHVGRGNAPDRGLQAEPPDVEFLSYPERTGRTIDYVLLWNVTDLTRATSTGAAIFDQLRKGYERVELPSGLLQLYRRRDLAAE